MNNKATWPIVRLSTLAADIKGAIVGGPFGSDLVSRDYVSSGVPVIRGRNLPNNAKFSYEDLVFVSERKADSLRLNCASPGDIVFTQRGTLGQVGLIPKNSPYPRFLISQSQMKMTVDVAKADPLYLYYYFRLPSTVSYIEMYALQAGVPHINLGILRKCEVIQPPLHVQQKIAATLSVYDELIDNNQRRIALLKNMAEEIYREWFIRLRFPGHGGMKVSKGVPSGWEQKCLPEIANITYGFAFDASRFNTEGKGRPIIRIRNISESVTTDYTDEVANNKYIVRHGDLVVGMDGEFHINQWQGDDAYLVQRVCKIEAKNPILEGYLAHAIRAPIKHFESILMGATVGHLGAMHLKNILLLVPPANLQEHLNVLNDIHRQILQISKATRALSRTRDMLLPRLISGQLSVETLDIRFPPSMEDAVQPESVAHA
jgi:type I restriction enzyme S subunit